MDLLASLNVDDLPEQQTRTSHLIEANPDFQLKLGFDACCVCGISITATNNTVCRICQRVSYCSDACREIDANILNGTFVPSNDPDIEPDNALGHTSVICSLLNLCNDDEAIDNNEGDTIIDPIRREAAIDRVRSEYESYPATLANVLLEGSCYQETIRRLHRNTVLIIHVIGASEDAELSCGPTIDPASSSSSSSSSTTRNRVCNDYAEALAEFADKCKVQSIELVFIGPDCPQSPFNEFVSMNYLDKDVGTLHIRSIKSLYNQSVLDNETNIVDFVIMYNPGLTCPDYTEWDITLQFVPNGTPFLIVTNTEMEGIADCQYLYEQNKIQSLPPMIADILGISGMKHDEDSDKVRERDGDDEDSDPNQSFFSINPFCGNRVRQNGTMANDVFVKNRWMIGGIMDSFHDVSNKDDDVGTKQKKKIKIDDDTTDNYHNSKMTNPALI